MTNFLAETFEVLKSYGKSSVDVLWVSIREPRYLTEIRPTPEPVPCGSWADFERFANFEYDNGYGGAEINAPLIIVGEDWWLERGEYDGSEWWEFKTMPRKPVEITPLRKTDLMDD